MESLEAKRTSRLYILLMGIKKDKYRRPVDDETVLYGVHDLYGIRGDVCLHMNV